MKQDTSQSEPAKPTQRLCNEIQLFDLCDLDRCSYKVGRFCTRKELLDRFEHLPDEDDLPTEPSGNDRFDGERDGDEMLFGEEDEFEAEGDGFDPGEEEWQD